MSNGGQPVGEVGIDMLNTHSATSCIDRLALNAAAPNSPVNSTLPWLVQKSMPPSTPARGVQDAIASPAFLAPVAVWASRKGDQRASSPGATVTAGLTLRAASPPGSNTRTWPSL